MKIIESLLLTMYFSNNTLSGRTVVQKLLYFLNERKIISTIYFPHYYGPYSTEVYNTLVKANLFNFIKEDVIVFERGGLMYVYQLTNDGKKFVNKILKDEKESSKKVNEIISICERYTGFDAQKLANAAKLHYLLKTGDIERSVLHSNIINIDLIKNAYRQYGWIPIEKELSNSITLLNKLDLL